MDSFVDRLKESWESVNHAAIVASAGMALVAAGIQAAVIKALEGANPDPNPIPTVLELMDVAPGYWQLFSETAPLTTLITLIAAFFWPAEPKTRPPRNDREFAQAIIHKGPFIDEIFFLVLAAPIALFLVIWIGRLDLSDQPKLIEPISVLGPFNAIISIINFFGKFYFAYGHGRFWSSIVLGICLGALSRTLVSTWGHEESGSISGPTHAKMVWCKRNVAQQGR